MGQEKGQQKGLFRRLASLGRKYVRLFFVHRGSPESGQPRPSPFRAPRGQNMIEYMLMFAAVVAVMIVALGPKGLVTKAVDKSLNMMFDSVEDMSREPCLVIDVVNGGWSGFSSWGAFS